MAAASAALVWAIASVPYVPTHDGPSHILSGHIENHFDDPGTIYSRHLSRAPQYASRGFALLFVPLERLLGWMAATKAVLAITALGGVWATAALVLRLEPKRRWTALLPFAFAFPWTLYMGFFSYSVSAAFGIGVVAFVVGRDLTQLRWRILLVLAMALHAHLHVFAALVTAVTVFVVLSMRAPREQRVRHTLIAAALVLPPFLLLARASLDVGAYRQMSDRLEWRSFSERVLTLPRIAAPGPAAKGLLALAIVIVGIWMAWRRHKRGDAHRDELALACCAAGWLVLGAAGPFYVPGWQYVSPRFVQLAVALGVTLVGSELLRDRRRQAFAALATLAALAGLELSRALHATMYSGCADALAGLTLPIQRTKVQLSFVVDPHCGVPADPKISPTPWVSPLEHIGALYAASEGGTLPIMFLGSPSIHAFMPREISSDEEFPAPPAEGLPRALAENENARRNAIRFVAAHAAFYESFLLFGARPDEIDDVIGLGFQTRWRSSSSLIAEFRGCPMELEVDNPPADGNLELAYSTWPTSAPLSVRTFPRSRERGAAPMRIPLPYLACGDLWLRPVWLSDATPDQGTRCEGSAPDGRIRLRANAGAAVVHCRLLVSQ